MIPKYNIWLELDGKVVLSVWRVRLLEAIEEKGSITSAAAALNVPYRRAWQRLHEMEERLGVTLVKTEVGGVGGGGAKLTPEAKDLINRFHLFADGLGEEIINRFENAFREG
ncbi:MAG TPA: LysR family transcriptional regulator [Anaerolineae bacterium]|nr:LysR family transcriptional regulator [Anaerolineae bacterium]